MTNYGFVIDNRKCIGCHACSTACKSENDVPLGVYRTWVKSVETGAYPNTRRHFQVTRCNHCANPPCVRICPVTAMYQRADGIVEFDPSLCIGCKACLQACPYDAIYIDPQDGTAAKCHYCAHRTEIGLEPACVVVCPEHAIIAGDIDDPASEISRVLAQEKVTVRKPEQGTAPKLFYIEGSDVTLHPTAVQRAPHSFAFADVIPLHDIPVYPASPPGSDLRPPAFKTTQSGAAIRPPGSQGEPSGGPIHIGAGRMADNLVRVTYNAQHKIPWHWPVPAYLVTKSIGAGLFMLLSLGWGLRLFDFAPDAFLIALFLSLLFTGLTAALLVYDLEKPGRFLNILLRPQWRSWLTRGAFLLIGFSATAGLWWLLEAGAHFAILPAALAESLRPVLSWLGLPLAAGSAVYTAFLFGQAEGRDLWQSGLLPLHLLVQAALMGSGVLTALSVVLPLPPGMAQAAFTTFAGSLILNLLVTFLGEFGMPHASEVAARAAHDITHGSYKAHFWLGSILTGHAAPLLLLAIPHPLALILAALCAIIGLYAYEYAFVMAPQEIPNS